MRTKPFYVVKITRQSGFPNLNAYTHCEAIAKDYALQWDYLDPEIYLFYADNIIELTNDNPEYNAIMKSEFMSEESKIDVMYIQLNGFHVRDDEKYPFLFTSQQFIDLSEGTDIMSEFIHLVVVAVGNMVCIGKYIKDPLFKQLMMYIFNKYITLMIISDTLVTYENIDMDKLIRIDERHKKTKLDSNGIVDWNDYVDQFYLSYITIKNNN